MSNLKENDTKVLKSKRLIAVLATKYEEEFKLNAWLLNTKIDIVNKILRARNNHEKEYIVTVNKPITIDFIQKIRNGLPILDQITKKCFAEQIHKKEFRIILTQGLNRQIRRMCEYLEYRVVKLKRIRIMNIELNTKVGRYRDLTKKEMTELLSLLSDSEKHFKQ